MLNITGRWQPRMSAYVKLLMLTSLSMACTYMHAAPVTIAVRCAGDVVGQISVDVSGAGISGGFKSSVGGPPPTLAAAAMACHEDHFNWYQIVTADNFPPKDAGGNQIPKPPPAYVDPPPGGYSDQWADKLPWYWDETTPPAGTPNFDPGLQRGAQTTADTLKFSDFPGGQAGTNLSLKTWLVSLNADSSFDSFHGGFSWDWSNSTGTSVASNITALNTDPSNAEYQNIIGGFATAVPEPGTCALIALGALVLLRGRQRA